MKTLPLQTQAPDLVINLACPHEGCEGVIHLAAIEAFGINAASRSSSGNELVLSAGCEEGHFLKIRIVDHSATMNVYIHPAEESPTL